MSDLSKIEFMILVRAYLSGCTEHPRTATATRLSALLGFGRIRGRKWIVEQSDRRRIHDYLVSFGLRDLQNPAITFRDMTRIETAYQIPEEKFAGRKPREGRVLVRSVDRHVKLNGATSYLFDDAAIDLPAANIRSIDHDCVLGIENFEAFNGFETLDIRDFPFRDPLLVYRGDAINFPDASKRLFENAMVPVVAFTDMDPHGLNIAASIPNVIGAIFPADLKGLNRANLFADQRAFLGPRDKYPVPWHVLIEHMEAARKCMTQEHMFAHRIPFQFLPVQEDSVCLPVA
ncbi:hypothetical protein KTQ42_22755 [Noviherbaspirillum sp. L7-7A]|uniref:DUF7281 domain-containing protein n=1 Tax=Noviherbaspirillum sp. L7-7A TaxID=2850560 RepID=UPI001C2C936C|nr:hypothetical protein [Noviherbaspirillum sp. L7-7A]MBV0882101.1 hypothetical protein [Noviherbaspirillum sp. L7-7A]